MDSPATGHLLHLNDFSARLDCVKLTVGRQCAAADLRRRLRIRFACDNCALQIGFMLCCSRNSLLHRQFISEFNTYEIIIKSGLHLPK